MKRMTTSRRLAVLIAWPLTVLFGGTLAASILPPGTARADDEAGFVPIFNGKDLDGWDGNPKFWSVKDGAIVGQTTTDNPTKGNTFLIWRNGTVDDFVLRATFKLTAHNSGIQYRSVEVTHEELEPQGNKKEAEKKESKKKEGPTWVMAGYQADMEDGDKYTGCLYEERRRGILADRGKKVVINADGTKQQTDIGDPVKLQADVKKGDWNEYEIIASGNHLIQRINGKLMCECIDNQVDKRALSGLVGLQLHAGRPMKVEFKNIRLKRTRLAAVDGVGERKKVVMVAGTPSHGIGEHEFNAGTILLQKCLNKLPNIVAAAYLNGWPKDPTAFDNADTIVLYMDGGLGHPLTKEGRLAQMERVMDQGTGLCCLHYAVEIPKDNGGPQFLRWIGGYYEHDYSFNPTWEAAFSDLPKHAVTRGVKPFTIADEWYYNMRFPDGQKGTLSILKATPPDATRGTAAAKATPGRIETVAWTTERPDGGRGFGFTGGHYHKNWENDDFRKLVLNAILWTAKAEVPANGVASAVSADELKENLDPKAKKK